MVNVARVVSEDMHGYYLAKEAQELRLEAERGTRERHSNDAEWFFQAPGTEGRGERPVTLKDWLRHARPSAPDPTEVQAVQAADLIDAQHRVAATLKAYQEACEVRDLAVADAVAAGWTVRAIGALWGTSQTPPHQCLQRFRRRGTPSVSGTYGEGF